MLPEEVCVYLEGASLGLNFSAAGPNLYAVPYPETAPDLSAYVEITNAEKSDRTFGPELQAPLGEWVEFCVMVRDGRERARQAQQLAHDIYKKLDGLGPRTLSSVLYRDVRATHGPPRFLDWDDNDRPLYYCLYLADKDRS